MNFAPKVGPLVAEFLSGSTALLLGYFLLPYNFSLHSQAGFAIPAFALSAWIVGTFVDALRNLAVETLLDKRWELEWALFIHGNREHIAGIEEYFFSFYRIDMDIALAILLFLIAGPFIPYAFLNGPIASYSIKTCIALLVPMTIFFLDAISLRSEVRAYLKK
jgi:hypothetical protein